MNTKILSLAFQKKQQVPTFLSSFFQFFFVFTWSDFFNATKYDTGMNGTQSLCPQGIGTNTIKNQLIFYRIVHFDEQLILGSFRPQVPLRPPCYDFISVTDRAV